MDSLEKSKEVPETKDELAELIISRVEGYIRDLDGVKGLPIHSMIVSAVERPLFRWAMEKTEGNQKMAAKVLGINRNTLHKKLCEQGFWEDSDRRDF